MPILKRVTTKGVELTYIRPKTSLPEVKWSGLDLAKGPDTHIEFEYNPITGEFGPLWSCKEPRS